MGKVLYLCDAVEIADVLGVEMNDLYIKELENTPDRKPTINELRKENGLSAIPGGDVVLTKV